MRLTFILLFSLTFFTLIEFIIASDRIEHSILINLFVRYSLGALVVKDEYLFR